MSEMKVARMLAAIGAIGLLILAFDVNHSLLSRRVVHCNGLAANYQLDATGSYQCEDRGFLRKSRFYIFETLGNKKGTLTFIANDQEGRKVTFLASTNGPGNFTIVSLPDRKLLTQNIGIVSGYSSNRITEATVVIPKGHAGIQLVAGGEGSVMVGRFRSSAVTADTVSATVTPSVGDDSRIAFLSLVACVLIGFAIIARGKMQQFYVPGLAVALLLSLWFLGTPFGTQVGWVDPGDDTSYVSWAWAFGYNFDGNLVNVPIESWAKNNNHHTWGTGFLLSPGLMLLKLIYPQAAGLNSLMLSIMATTSIFWAFASVFVYFKAFSLVMDKQVAWIVALCTLIGTSMLKWTFLRNIFSHSPEAFGLSLGTLFFIKRYYVQDRRWSNLLMLIGSIILTMQIRRENILLCLLPIYAEFFAKAEWPAKIRAMAALFGGVVSGQLLLQAGNLMTKTPKFFYSPTARFFEWESLGQSIVKNFSTVLYGSEVGLFAWWNFPAFLAVVAMALSFRKHKALTVAYVGIVAAYLLMCLTFSSPHGDEWQNRFLLKLNPIVFGACGYLAMRQRIPLLRTLVLGLVMASAAYEVVALYPTQVPPGLPLFYDMVTDLNFIYPQNFDFKRLVDFMPMWVLSLVAGGIFFAAFRGSYLSDRIDTSHSSGVCVGDSIEVKQSVLT